ncbi:HAD family phosphatase [Amylibacter sp. IMCC11727]|uniref:HAD family hydrolase n=1 Tax=Amylibacter sp. IMCC11727 TaxID=3039851 RepID=UPI00244E26AC|nr:HAD family phosphatase [Amylibacter sp. IMCC11727]WGI21974.1 HAD family phosphatase [Amylibacter sp. IMCC11727]
MPKEIEAVVFDIGNVLIEWQPERFYDTVMPAEDRVKMFETIDLHRMNDLVDRGANWRDTVYATAEEYPEYRDMIRLWHDRWIEMASPAIDASVDVLRKLRMNFVPVFALSNFGIQTFEYAETVYPFLQEFDQRYISGYRGEVKPEPRIYEILEQNCGVAPDRLLFADDRQENLDAAAARGWNVHLFDGPEGWIERLKSEGLL